MISFEHVSYAYPESPTSLFSNLNLHIEAGEHVGVIGPGGAGKSTLGKLVKGLLVPASGRVLIAGDTLTEVGYVGGDPAEWLVGMTVEEDVAFGLVNVPVPPAEIDPRVRHALFRVGLEGMEERLVHTLSGGEQQKTVLAGLLAMGARILILDDAFNMLDRPGRYAIRSFVTTLRQEGNLTVLEITDRFEDVVQCSRLVFLCGGEILFDGLPGDFLMGELGRGWCEQCGGYVDVIRRLYERGILTQPRYDPQQPAAPLLNSPVT